MCTLVFMQSTHYSCQILMNFNFLYRVSKNTQISNSKKICHCKLLFHVDRWKDGQMDVWADNKANCCSFAKKKSLALKQQQVQFTHCFRKLNSHFSQNSVLLEKLMQEYRTLYHKSDNQLCHVCPSVCAHGTARLQLDGFFMKLDI